MERSTHLMQTFTAEPDGIRHILLGITIKPSRDIDMVTRNVDNVLKQLPDIVRPYLRPGSTRGLARRPR